MAGQNNQPHVKRWEDQRWALDNVIRSVTIDWDQPRSFYLNAACGMEASADFAAIRERVKKYADIEPAFANTARRREAKAKAAEADGALVTARDNYFMAAIHWGSAQWSRYENDETNLAFNKSKREAYMNYVRLAAHKIEPVFIPLNGGQMPGWFHLPPNYKGGRIPVVISFPGMDTYKEVFVALKGDRWLERGIAVLALDGPGQAECRVMGLTVSMENWTQVGKAAVDWLMQRPKPAEAAPVVTPKAAPNASSAAREKPKAKLSFKEQRELDTLPAEIEKLEQEQLALTNKMSSGMNSVVANPVSHASLDRGSSFW